MKYPIFVINLDGSDDRLRVASAQLAAEGLEFERFPAFDGRHLTPAEFPDYDAEAAKAYMGRPLRGGEIGCYLSHLKCAGTLIDRGEAFGLVLEDDVHLAPGFSGALSELMEILADMPQEWDVINIGANRLKIWSSVRELKSGVEARRLVRGHYFPMTTTGLIWSRAGAERFLGCHDRIFAPVDNYLRHWQTRTDRGLAVWPPMVSATGAGSLIDAGHCQRSREGRHLLYSLIKQRRLMTDKAIACAHKIARKLSPRPVDQAGSLAKRR